ncbi:cytochrome b [Pseudoxanthomonas kalamensis]|uniref:cytochrome b n=1 Tax=Pseudoxanthomonas kalamensis TaxID=289483 RepID=UPI002483656F|nr:cytochrome b/b6 domain-containing protein [Pseudoxanthomonas kalamensis]
MRASPSSFSLSQRLLHWAMVLLILCNLLFPQGMGGTGLDLGFVLPARAHICIGIAVLVLALIRLFLRLGRGVPSTPTRVPVFFRGLARAGQWTFYLLFFATPITGLLIHYHGNASALLLHGKVIRPLFWTLIAVHVALALAHQYYWKTGRLEKMVRG